MEMKKSRLTLENLLNHILTGVLFLHMKTATFYIILIDSKLKVKLVFFEAVTFFSSLKVVLKKWYGLPSVIWCEIHALEIFSNKTLNVNQYYVKALNILWTYATLSLDSGVNAIFCGAFHLITYVWSYEQLIIYFLFHCVSMKPFFSEAVDQYYLNRLWKTT